MIDNMHLKLTRINTLNNHVIFIYMTLEKQVHKGHV